MWRTTPIDLDRIPIIQKAAGPISGSSDHQQTPAIRGSLLCNRKLRKIWATSTEKIKIVKVVKGTSVTFHYKKSDQPNKVITLGVGDPLSLITENEPWASAFLM